MSLEVDPNNFRDPEPDAALLKKGLAGLPKALRMMGYSGLRPGGQDSVVMSMLAGIDSINVLPTSAGKTACFVIPALAHDWKLLIFSPLKALMKDQVDNLGRMGIPALNLSSANTEEINRRNMGDWLDGHCKILYVAPERLVNREFKALMRQSPPDMIAVDECFPPEVEILTDRGFVPFGEYDGSSKVAQVDARTGQMTMVSPTKVILKDYEGDMIRLSGAQSYDLPMTPNHELLLYGGSVPYKIPVKDAVGEYDILTAARKMKGKSRITSREALDFVLRLCDATKVDDGVCEVRLWSVFQKSRLAELTEVAGVECRPVSRPGKTGSWFEVGVEAPESLWETLDPMALNFEGARKLMSELYAWKIPKKPKTHRLITRTLADASFVQTLAVISGYGSRVESSGGLPRVLFYADRDTVRFRSTSKRTERGYKGKVHCVRVPKGNIVVRHGGRPLVVGNCHTLSAWTDNFRHSFVYIGDIIDAAKPRLVAGFTATYSREIDADVRRVLRLPKAKVLAFYPRRNNLILSSEARTEDDHDLHGWIRDTPGKILIYCDSRKRTEQVAQSVYCMNGETAGFYNAGMSDNARKEAQDSFANGDIRVMAATNAFGMGIDIPDIRSVVHFDHPADPEALSQEIGRAGRDGAESWCHTYSSFRAASMCKRRICSGNPTPELIQSFYEYLVQSSSSDGTFHQSPGQIMSAMRISEYDLPALMELMSGSGVYVDVEDVPKYHKLTFTGEPGESKAFGALERAIAELGTLSPSDGAGVRAFDIDQVAPHMGMTPATLKKYLKGWDADGVVQYVAPPRSKPKRLVGDLSLIDMERLAGKRKLAFHKLSVVLGYFEVDDSEKHGYLEDYFTDFQ